MINKILFLGFVLFSIFQSFGQQEKVDSLRNKLTQSNNDTLRIILMEKIANLEFYRDLSSFKTIVDSMYLLSVSINSDKHIAYSNSSLGRFYFQTSKYDSAKICHKRATKTYELINDTSSLASTYGNLASTYMNEGKYLDSANFFLNKALELNLKTDNTENLFYNYYNLSIQKSSQGLNEQALDFSLRALEMSKKLDNQRYIAYSLSSIGLCYLSLELFIEAESYFLEAYQICKEIEDVFMTADQLNNLAVVESEGKKNYRKAISLYKEANSVYLNSDSPFHNVVTTANIGRNYLKLNILDTAKIYLNKSYLIAKEINQTAEMARSLSNLAEIYEIEGNLILARSKIEEAVRLNQENNFIQEYGESKVQLSNVYAKLNQYKKAYYHLEEGKKIGDSIVSIEQTEAIATINTKYQTQQKEKQILEQQNSLANKELQLAQQETKNTYYAGAALLGGMGILLLFLNFQRRKRKLINANQLQIIKAKDAHSNRIGIQLHDGKATRLKEIAKELKKTGVTTIGNELKEMALNIRDLAYELKRVPFSHSELDKQIITLASKYYENGLTIELNGLKKVDWPRWDDAIKRNIYIIVEQALLNIEKHAGADKVTIKFLQKGKKLHLEIKDNGKGFEATEEHFGLGISSMHIRVRELDGKIEFNSQKQKGTSIFIQLTLA